MAAQFLCLPALMPTPCHAGRAAAVFAVEPRLSGVVEARCLDVFGDREVGAELDREAVGHAIGQVGDDPGPRGRVLVVVMPVHEVEDGRYSTPSLTTISPDKTEIARLSVDLLMRRMDGDDTPPVQLNTSFTLKVRESTART